MAKEKNFRNFESKISISSAIIKIILIPVLLAFMLRYLPHALLGNVKIYPETIPISVIDDFLSEENILEIQNLIKLERRFATAVEASTGGDQGYVKFMGEEEPVNEEGKCNEPDFFAVDGKLCGFGGRVDVLKHFIATGGFWGAKETIPKLSR